MLVFNKALFDPKNPDDTNKTDELSQDYRTVIDSINEYYTNKMSALYNIKDHMGSQEYKEACDRMIHDKNMAILTYLNIEHLISTIKPNDWSSRFAIKKIKEGCCACMCLFSLAPYLYNLILMSCFLYSAILSVSCQFANRRQDGSLS